MCHLRGIINRHLSIFRLYSPSVAPFDRSVVRALGDTTPTPSDPAPTPTSTPEAPRRYPNAVRVGIGAVVLRPSGSTSLSDGPDVLLVKRGKNPGKGLWAFPGGTQELGETMAACAARECLEETGVAVRLEADDDTPSDLSDTSLTLGRPRPFTAVDAISHDAQGRVEFHYTIVEMACSPCDPGTVPLPGDDAEDARWFPVSILPFPGMSPGCDRVAREAVTRFRLP